MYNRQVKQIGTFLGIKWIHKITVVGLTIKLQSITNWCSNLPIDPECAHDGVVFAKGVYMLTMACQEEFGIPLAWYV